MSLAVENITGAITNPYASSTTVSVSTSGANRLVVLAIGIGNASAAAPTVSSITGASLTWTKRKAEAYFETTLNTAADVELWYAFAPTQLTSSTITINFSGSVAYLAVSSLAVSGANSSTPWDVNGSLPAGSTNATFGSSTTPSETISTTALNTIIFGFYGSYLSAQAPGTISGFTVAESLGFSGTNGINTSLQYKIVSSQESSAAIACPNSVYTWGFIVDAAQQASAVGLSQGIIIG